jgi:hypothetical protein
LGGPEPEYQLDYRLVYPDDKAVKTSPFIDLWVGSVGLGERFLSPISLGLGLGLHAWDRVLFGAQLTLLGSSIESDDNAENRTLPEGFRRIECRETSTCSPAQLVYGFRVGVVAVDDDSFIMAPSLNFLRSDESVYGSAVGLTIPFLWVTSVGLRIGWDLGPYISFGGGLRARCEAPFVGTGVPTCEQGEERDFDRPVAAGFVGGFTLGFGFGSPEAKREYLHPVPVYPGGAAQTPSP